MVFKKKKRPRGTERWQAVPNDAIRLAALRWFALTIEKEAIELYATNTLSFPEMEKILRKALGDIDDLRDKFAAEEDGCPEGYFLCDDDVCRPSCDKITSDS
jgi:hypothetical protein